MSPQCRCIASHVFPDTIQLPGLKNESASSPERSESIIEEETVPFFCVCVHELLTCCKPDLLRQLGQIVLDDDRAVARKFDTVGDFTTHGAVAADKLNKHCLYCFAASSYNSNRNIKKHVSCFTDHAADGIYLYLSASCHVPALPEVLLRCTTRRPAATLIRPQKPATGSPATRRAARSSRYRR